MTCADVDQMLSAAIPVPEIKRRQAVQAHLEQCPRCEELLSWAETPVPDPELEGPVNDRIRALLQADLKPVQPLPSTLAAVGGAFALAAIVGLLGALTMGMQGWEALSPLQAACLGALGLITMVLSTASLMASIRPGSRQVVHPAMPILTIGAGFPILVVWLFPAGSREQFVSHGISCLVGGMLAAALTAGLTYTLARRGYSTNWPRTGALVGVLGATVAVAALQICCGEQEFGHVTLWHGLPIVLSIGGGYLAGRRTAASGQQS